MSKYKVGEKFYVKLQGRLREYTILEVGSDSYWVRTNETNINSFNVSKPILDNMTGIINEETYNSPLFQALLEEENA